VKYARILSAFYFQPWNMIVEKHRSMGQILQQHVRGELQAEPMPRFRAAVEPGVVGPVDDDGTPLVPQMEIIGNIAIIPVQGVLGRHLDFLDLWCGGCDYDHVCEMAELADANPFVAKILFNISSPGGSATGNPEAAARIAALDKPTIAYGDEMIGSAAYWLASQCDAIFVAPSMQIGSIGSYLAAIDTSREFEMQGWKLMLFRSGDLKGSQVDGHEWTQKEIDYFQQQVSYVGNMFKQGVLSNRPQIAAEDMQGQGFFGAQAVDKGLADGVCDDICTLLAALQV
jgi:ClpP class serine protease